MATNRTVFAFAGWNEEERAIRHLVEEEGEVVTLTLDVGQGRDLDAVREQALEAGAVRAHVMDVRDTLAREFVLPALQACGAIDGGVPLSRELRLAVIMRALTEVAAMESAAYLAHGGDRDETSLHGHIEELVQTLRPDVYALLWPMTLVDDETPADRERSVRVSVAGREQRLMPAAGPPAPGLFKVTRERTATPDTPAFVAVDVEAGVPVGVNGVRLAFPELLDSLDTIVGVHGVGRFDGLLGPYSVAYDQRTRHVGEAPALLVLATAFDALERRLWPAELVDLKAQLAATFRSLVRRGRWFSPTRLAISAFVQQAHRELSGSVRLELFKGGMRVLP
jgi:argininosuccinate synthase